MADSTYRIVRQPDDTFAVEIKRIGALPQTAAGFETEAAAQGWIARDRRLLAGSGPYGRPAGRRWHGT